MGTNLLNKVWDLHTVARLPSGQDQLFIGLHLIHEVTSPQAFHMLAERGLAVRHPERTVATVDHIVPTDSVARPLSDPLAEKMLEAIEENVREHGIRFFGLESAKRGIVHIIGPELGLTQPGLTIACGDSHTSTHGAFGAIAFGIGTSQIRDILASQTIAISRPKVRRIQIDGSLAAGVYAKDVILRLIADLGVKGGIGYAYEFGGPVLDALDMEGRMTICNMSIEGGARVGYVNPDQTTYDYIKGREYAPSGDAFDRAVTWWSSIASDMDADYNDRYELDADTLQPMVTWGVNPGQAMGVRESTPDVASLPREERQAAERAFDHMQLSGGRPLAGQRIDVAFIGSCTNGRIGDLREAARVVKGRRVANGVTALVVPGSAHVAVQAEQEGLASVFEAAGFQWRGTGCSMCLAMNPDKLVDDQLCASSSNRNFIGRQGSPRGRTVLMSPAMVAAAAVTGEIIDVRELMGEATGAQT